jgi:hypothetical protein
MNPIDVSSKKLLTIVFKDLTILQGKTCNFLMLLLLDSGVSWFLGLWVKIVVLRRTG